MNSNLHVLSQKMYLTRSALDSLNFGLQPYSSRLKKLVELQNQISEFEKSMNLTESSYDLLKTDKEAAESLLKDCSTRLRNMEITLRNTKFEKIIARYSEDFSRSFNA